MKEQAELDYRRKQAEIDRDNYIMPLVYGLGAVGLLGIIVLISKSGKKNPVVQNNISNTNNNTNNASFSSNQTQSSIAERLERLKRLYNSGVITAAEYNKKRAEILDNI